MVARAQKRVQTAAAGAHIRHHHHPKKHEPQTQRQQPVLCKQPEDSCAPAQLDRHKMLLTAGTWRRELRPPESHDCLENRRASDRRAKQEEGAERHRRATTHSSNTKHPEHRTRAQAQKKRFVGEGCLSCSEGLSCGGQRRNLGLSIASWQFPL